MKKILLLFNFLLCTFFSFSQNLVLNPDFEIYGNVPCGWTSSPIDFAAATDSWTSPTQATPDIFSTLISQTCSNYQPNSTYPMPNGYQVPHSGNIFGGFYTTAGSWREYLQAALVQPLVVGDSYVVSMYVSLSDNSTKATNNIGVDFTTSIANVNTTDELGYAPLINHSTVISDTSNWVYLADTIVATDAWQYLTIGNFYNDFGTTIVTFNPSGFWDRSYYYVDDVSVELINSVSSSAFAAADTSLCEKFCTSFIDSSTNNPSQWQWFFDGGNPNSSTDQNPVNICYSNPGSFDVTLITTYANGTDTLVLPGYINVYPTPLLPTITQSGYILTSSFATNYQWQYNSVNIPGATNQTYQVLQSGIYSVFITDDHGCSSSSPPFNVLITGIDDVASGKDVLIYPNPSNGNFMIQWFNDQFEGNVIIQIENTLGQIIYSSKEKISGAGFKKEIQINPAAAGFYLLDISVLNTAGNVNEVSLRKKILVL